MTKQRKRKVIGFIIIVVLALIVLEIALVCYFSKTHFLKGTQIGGVDCSYLTIDSAKEKVTEKYREKKCILNFWIRETHEIQLGELGVELDKAKFVKVFNEQHINRKAERNYNIEEVITINEEWLETGLKKIPQLQEENMHKPENARIEWNGTTFYVKGHVLGNEIDFQEAKALVLHDLEMGIFQIDFSPITYIYPEIMSENLADEVKELNSVVLSSMQFELTNGEIVTLDNDIIKTWVTTNDSGEYVIDTENGISRFVEELAVKVDEAESQLHFMPTDLDKEIVLEVPEVFRASLDKEKEIAEIKAALDSEGMLKPRLIYIGYPLSTRLNDFAELDKTRQTVWQYRDGSLVVKSECVTGNESQDYDTPSGIYTVINKAEDIVLRGLNRDGSKYEQPVDYWVGFIPRYGFHDSPRTDFGGEIYKKAGSHGCVNMPEKEAEVFYNNAYEGMLVIIYES